MSHLAETLQIKADFFSGIVGIRGRSRELTNGFESNFVSVNGPSLPEVGGEEGEGI